MPRRRSCLVCSSAEESGTAAGPSAGPAGQIAALLQSVRSEIALSIQMRVGRLSADLSAAELPVPHEQVCRLQKFKSDDVEAQTLLSVLLGVMKNEAKAAKAEAEAAAKAAEAVAKAEAKAAEAVAKAAAMAVEGQRLRAQNAEETVQLLKVNAPKKIAWMLLLVGNRSRKQQVQFLYGLRY